MISYIKGNITTLTPTEVIIETGGIGYHVFISLHTYEDIKDKETVKIHIYSHYTENQHVLYGFSKQSEREMYKLLISVSGVGLISASALLSNLDSTQIKEAIINEDIKTLQSSKGIGLKSAQRIIIDLKDKLLKTASNLASSESNTGFNTKYEAQRALEVLGYQTRQTEKIISQIMTKNPNIKLEELIKDALKRI